MSSSTVIAVTQITVFIQLAALAFIAIAGVLSKSTKPARVLAWLSTAGALVTLALWAVAQFAPGVITTADGASAAAGSVLTWVIISVAAVVASWGGIAVSSAFGRARREKQLASPETQGRVSAELKEILRAEAIDLDARLRQAEHDREQFLYALEDRHARQIQAMWNEYHKESTAALSQVLEQIAAESFRPMVEQRLAEHRAEIERELGAIDSAASGEALSKIREELAEVTSAVESAEERITKMREENPDTPAEEAVAKRVGELTAELDARFADVMKQFESKLAARTTEVEGRIATVASGLDGQVDTASHPLKMRMAEAEQAVEARLASWQQVLEARFAETEQLLNQRVLEHENTLEQRVSGLESSTEERLAAHTSSLEGMLAQHDEHLNASIAAQSAAVSGHADAERDRIIGEINVAIAELRSQVDADLTSAEEKARATVAASQESWNGFAAELEQRFVETREEALRAAEDIAAEQRKLLTEQLERIVDETGSDISAKVEHFGREASWQRTQVERVVSESMEKIELQARQALANADEIFADLERNGAARVDTIRAQAEAALIQSRDYVEQLQTSLHEHLETLREHGTVLGNDLGDRLQAMANTAQETASSLEQHAHSIVDEAARELAGISEHHSSLLQQQLANEIASSLAQQFALHRTQYEQQLGEISSRIVQQVNGELAGVAEQARGSFAAEFEQSLQQATQQIRVEQEQAYMSAINEIARQQGDLAGQAREATESARRILEESMRDARRQLEESMASMGAHMREELIRFQDEGRRRVDEAIARLRTSEQDMIRVEDRRMADARAELMHRHQAAMEDQVRNMVTGLSGVLTGGTSPAGGFSSGVQRPATPLTGGHTG